MHNVIERCFIEDEGKTIINLKKIKCVYTNISHSKSVNVMISVTYIIIVHS